MDIISKYFLNLMLETNLTSYISKIMTTIFTEGIRIAYGCEDFHCLLKEMYIISKGLIEAWRT